MNGLMMADQLTLDRLIQRARTLHRDTEVVSRLADRTVHRYSYGDCYPRVLRLMNALRRLGIKPGDRVASFAWNSYRHLELYFAVPALGAVLHTINVRLSASQIEYLANHAEDRVLFVDRSLVASIAAVRPQLRTVEHVVVMDDHAPDAPPAPGGAIDYEDLLADAGETEEFPALSEECAATLCYTSGTTGVLKGVMYSHRSAYLHALALCAADSLAVSMADSVLQVVPMFHVNAWGLPHAACLTGAKQVLPGPHLLGPPIAELVQAERVTVAAGVPSIWHVLQRTFRSGHYDISSFQRIMIGGSAAPRALIESYTRDFGIQMLHAWGMTEVSPVGTVNRLRPFMAEWPEDRRFQQLAKQGPPAPLVEMKIVDDTGREQPRDGTSIGELLVRGPWIARQYYREDGAEARPVTADGWLRTGDIASIDPYGYMAIADRKKDLIKTRGEWLSSVEMENAAMGHPAVLEAAVIGRPDDVRGEAVVLFVVPVPERTDAVGAAEVAAYLRERFQSWQVPRLGDIHFVDALPKTSVGKFDKVALRAKLAGADHGAGPRAVAEPGSDDGDPGRPPERQKLAAVGEQRRATVGLASVPAHEPPDADAAIADDRARADLHRQPAEQRAALPRVKAGHSKP
jgi:fatty-acyl-CoA synthase